MTTRLPHTPIEPRARGRKALTAGAAWADHLPVSFEACGRRVPRAEDRIIYYRVANLGSAAVLVFEGTAADRTAVGEAGGTVGGVSVQPGESITVSLNGHPVAALGIKSTGADSAVDLVVGLVE